MYVHDAVAAAMFVTAVGLGFLVLGLSHWLAPHSRRVTENPPPEYGGRTDHKTWM
jgi:hypothetical protein